MINSSRRRRIPSRNFRLVLPCFSVGFSLSYHRFPVSSRDQATGGFRVKHLRHNEYANRPAFGYICFNELRSGVVPSRRAHKSPPRGLKSFKNKGSSALHLPVLLLSRFHFHGYGERMLFARPDRFSSYSFLFSLTFLSFPFGLFRRLVDQLGDETGMIVFGCASGHWWQAGESNYSYRWLEFE